MKKMLLVGLCFLCGTAFASPKEDVVDFYTKVLAEKNACANFEEFQAFSLKYGSNAFLNAFQETEELRKEMPQDFQENMFKIIKRYEFPIKDLQIEKVGVDGNRATIAYGVNGKPGVEGIVHLEKEEGSWRLKRILEKEPSSTNDASQIPLFMRITLKDGSVARGPFVEGTSDSIKIDVQGIPITYARDKAVKFEEILNPFLYRCYPGNSR